MFQAIISIYFLVTFFMAAKSAGKNEYFWSIGGALSFFLSSTVISEVLGWIFLQVFTHFRMHSEYALATVILCLGAGLILGYFLTLRIKSKYLTHKIASMASPSIEVNDIQISGDQNTRAEPNFDEIKIKE